MAAPGGGSVEVVYHKCGTCVPRTRGPARCSSRHSMTDYERTFPRHRTHLQMYNLETNAAIRTFLRQQSPICTRSTRRPNYFRTTFRWSIVVNDLPDVAKSSGRLTMICVSDPRLRVFSRIYCVNTLGDKWQLTSIANPRIRMLSRRNSQRRIASRRIYCNSERIFKINSHISIKQIDINVRRRKYQMLNLMQFTTPLQN